MSPLLRSDIEERDPIFALLYGGLNRCSVEASSRATFLTVIATSPAFDMAEMSVDCSAIVQRQSRAFSAALDELADLPLWRAEIIGKLRADLERFRRLSQGWDGEDADEVPSRTADAAKQIVEQIDLVLNRANAASGPSVRPFPDGSIFLKWIYGQKELAITVDNERIAVQRWEPLEAYRSLGFWEIRPEDVQEHIEWLLA